MDVANTFASWIGYGTGIIAIVWPIITWRRSRHLIKVRVANFYLISASQPLEHFVQIESMNSGRDPIQITHWGITAGKGANLVFFEQLVISNDVPATLGQNETVHFYVRFDALRDACLEHELRPSDMRAWIVLSNGSKKFSRVTLKALFPLRK